MDLRNMKSQLLVKLRIGLVQQQKDQVKPREQRRRQINILVRRQLLIVSSVDRVGRGKDRRSRIQRRCDAALGNRNGLLLHDFMDVGSITVVHLVELINAAYAIIGKHEGTAFEYDLSRGRVLHHCGGQTGTG